MNGWSLYLYPLFDEQFQQLEDRVDAASKADPKGFMDRPQAKLLATVQRHILELIPSDPSAPEFRQGNTLGKANRHWFRSKFNRRYRLFFRYSTQDRIIVYAWVNDEATLRKHGSKTDPYAVFDAMLKSGNPPTDFDDLVAASRKMP